MFWLVCRVQYDKNAREQRRNVNQYHYICGNIESKAVKIAQDLAKMPFKINARPKLNQT